MNIDRIKIKKFSRIVSTQEYADKMKKYGENLIVTAEKQSGGKGTKGRSFSSEKGGVYLSSLLYYPNFPAEKSFLIMAGTCAAVCRTLEEGGLQAKIKWPNDVFVNGRKICGILTEAVVDFETQKLKYAIVGIGINVLNGKFPEELKNVASNIERESGVKINLNDLIAEIIKNSENFESEILSGKFFEEYKKRSILTGKTVRVVSGTEEFTATVMGISDSGALIVEKGGELIAVNAGDVSIRF